MPELTDQRIAEIEERCEKATPSCPRCRDKWTISVLTGTIYETDTAEERAGAWREQDCPECGNFAKRARTDIPWLIEQIKRLKGEREQAHRLALQLATAIYESNYRSKVPEWKPLNDTVGIIMQIDNMHTGVSRERDRLQAELAESEAKCARLVHTCETYRVALEVLNAPKRGEKGFGSTEEAAMKAEEGRN